VLSNASSAHRPEFGADNRSEIFFLMRQSIRLTKSSDGTVIAWAAAGDGLPLVKASNWLTHLQHELDSPVWRHWIKFFGEHYRFIRYDDRGCGLSQWEVAELSLERSVEDLQKIVEVAEPRKPFVLLGISQGGATAIRYAVAHPDHVSHLILYGVYAQGRAVAGDREAEERYRAIIALTRLGWGQNNPVYRQLFTARFIPGASEEQLRWFTDLCRRTVTAETAARIMESRMHIDVLDLLPRVTTPTLVLHARHDECVALSQGRLVASCIPDAKFVELDSRNHILLETEPAWKDFKEELMAFTGVVRREDRNDVLAALSPRERDVLAKIAAGCTNIEIGRQLFISEKTVRNHVTRIFEKLGVNSRAQAIVLAKDKRLLDEPSQHSAAH
jgi:pimeloyl-ACP methyl ester carboxylesterase/DNA-binding CsgD family transcriptional regulator